GIKAIVHPFFGEMHVALGAASAAITRAGASSLAELAAMRVPAILVPYPAATENHQFHNAAAFESAAAAYLINQRGANPQGVAEKIVELIGNSSVREKIQTALGDWHSPRAAEQIAD